MTILWELCIPLALCLGALAVLWFAEPRKGQ